MRKRLVRDFVTLAVVVLILAGLLFLNMQLRRSTLKERYDEYRASLEEERGAEGLNERASTKS